MLFGYDSIEIDDCSPAFAERGTTVGHRSEVKRPLSVDIQIVVVFLLIQSNKTGKSTKIF